MFRLYVGLSGCPYHTQNTTMLTPVPGNRHTVEAVHSGQIGARKHGENFDTNQPLLFEIRALLLVFCNCTPQKQGGGPRKSAKK